MNLNVNSVNFQGKKEIMYALTKAAQRAKDIEYYNQPAIASRLMASRHDMQLTREASMKAYLDMALHDEAFETTMKDMKASDFAYLQALLMPEKTQYTNVEPINAFKKAVEDVLVSTGKMKFSVQEVFENFYKKLGF